MDSPLNAVYLFDHDAGSRDNAMIAQGLLQHPLIRASFSSPVISLGDIVAPASKNLGAELLDANMIIRNSDSHFNHPEIDRFLDKHDLWSRVVYYDHRDSYEIDHDRLQHVRAYGKRSWTVGYNRESNPQIRSGKIFPLDYSLLGEYVSIPRGDTRCVNVGYYFPDTPGIGRRRYRVLQELKRAEARLGPSIIGKATAVGVNGRRSIFASKGDNPWLEYMQMLHDSRLVFTAFPDNWDGDSRTWEAFSSGALVFMDETSIPHRYPFVDGEHYVAYDARSRESIRNAIAKAVYYLNHDYERAAIANRGFAHACNYHMPVNRMQQILEFLGYTDVDASVHSRGPEHRPGGSTL